MGMLADFFVATPEQATRYANRNDEPDEGEEITALLNPCEYKRFTGLELGTLWAILEGVPWEVGKHMPKDTVLGTEGESWLERLPDELTHLLSKATPEALAKAGSSWANTEELTCEPADLDPVLADLQRLAQQAILSGRSVYLWGCLQSATSQVSRAKSLISREVPRRRD